jgi:hypothetical protein
MKNKDVYTQIFLKAAEETVTNDSIKSKKSVWWWNNRNKDSGGLRLTEEGIQYITDSAKLKTYTVKFPKEITITPQILIWLDNFIESPYFITKKDITVITEKAAFELYLFSGDIRKMGYGKALSKRMSQE